MGLRWPTPISQLIAELDPIDYVSKERNSSLANPLIVFEILLRAAEPDPDYARRKALKLLERLPDAAGRKQLLHLVGDHWADLGGDLRLLNDLTELTQASADRFPADSRSLGIALGQAVYAYQEADFQQTSKDYERSWQGFADALFLDIETVPISMKTTAERWALAHHLSLATSQQRQHAQSILDNLFLVEAKKGPPQVIGSFLVELMATDSSARRILIQHLRRVLENGLPAEATIAHSSAKRWAQTARAALEDQDTPMAVVRAVLEDIDVNSRELWHSPGYLLNVLQPAAIAGVPPAVTLLSKIADAPQSLAPWGDAKKQQASRNDFIQDGLKYAERDLLVAQAVLSVGFAADRFGVVQALLAHPHGRTAVTARREDVRRLIERGMAGADERQRESANLLLQAQQQNVLPPALEDIERYLKMARSPRTLSILTETTTLLADVDGVTHRASIELIENVVLAPLLSSGIDPGDLSRIKQGVLDSAYAAKRFILAQLAEGDEWPEFWGLVLQAPYAANTAVTTDRFRDVSAFLYRMCGRGQPDLNVAVDYFIQSMQWAQANMKPKQAKVISNHLLRVARYLMRHAGTAERRRLIDAAPTFPPRLANFIVTMAIAGHDAGYVESHKDSFAPETVQVVVEALRGNRELGYMPIPWIIH